MLINFDKIGPTERDG